MKRTLVNVKRELFFSKREDVFIKRTLFFLKRNPSNHVFKGILKLCLTDRGLEQ